MLHPCCSLQLNAVQMMHYFDKKFRSTKTCWARPVVTVIRSGHQKLTGVTAPRSGSDHLMVDGHDSDQQNRPEQKIFRVAPQFLDRKKSRDHCGSRAKAATELLIGRVTRFVPRRCLTPPRAPSDCHPPAPFGCALPAPWIPTTRAAQGGCNL